VTRRPGFALVVSLLLVVVLAALGAAMLALGAREAEIATAVARRAEAHRVAESAARWAVATWSTRQYQRLAPGDSMVVEAPFARGLPQPEGAGLEGRAIVRRLGERLFLVQSTAHRGEPGPPAAGPAAGPVTGPVTGRAALLVRTFDPDALARAFPAAASADDSVIVRSGSISGAGPCEDAPAATIVAPRHLLDPDASVEGALPLLADPPPIPEPSPFADTLVRAIASITIPGGSVAPRPWSGGDGCLDDPLNWGAASPTNACHDRLPFVHALEDLEVTGGEARALLLVRGDLHLRDVEFHGLIITDGRVIIGNGTVIHGAVRARTVDMQGGSLVRDACALRAALFAGGLDAPFRPGSRHWLPAF
jgi:hypothetical protein